MSNVPKTIKDWCAPFTTQIDLSANQYNLVKLSSGLIILSSSKAEAVIGVLVEKVKGTSSDEKTCQVQIGGIARVKLSGNVSEMGYVISAGDGTAIADDGANQFVVGKALEDGVSGDVIAVLLSLNPTLTA